MDISYIKAGEPTSVIIGDTIEWKKTLIAQYQPCEDFTLTYELRGSSGAITITATKYDDSMYKVSVPAATSTLWKEGTYYWQSYVSKTVDSTLERYSVENGTIEIVQNLEVLGSGTASPADQRTKFKKILDALDDSMLNKAIDDVITVQVDGDMIISGSMGDAIRLRNLYAALVAKEENEERAKRGLPSTNIIRTIFTG